MTRNGDAPELLEQFMEESGENRRWVTVNEIRTRFHLGELSSPAIQGFLQRLHTAPFFAFPYRVERIEKVSVPGSRRRSIRRYLVSRRTPGKRRTPPPEAGSVVPERDRILTDQDAIGHFDRISLGKDRYERS